MNKPLILIVEDDPDHGAVIEAMFKTCLAHVRTHLVLKGEEARSYLSGRAPYQDLCRYPFPSLIVLDLGLPDISGFEILEWMAEWSWLAEIPVIVFTASDSPEHARRADELDVRRYVTKPGLGHLIAAVREELHQRPEEQQRNAGA